MTSIVFSHGKESGPQGSKILAMSKVAASLGFSHQSIDYQGLDDPISRIAKCKNVVSHLADAPILVGSSMGGYVSTAVASELRVRSLFVLAPAFGMSGYPDLITPACPIEIIHGWSDEVVPVENSIRFAQEACATLHLIDGDHRLTAQIGSICAIFRLFLESYALS